MVSAKDAFSVVVDRDFLTIFFVICFCLSFLGISLHVFSFRDSGLFLMTVLLSRLLFIYRGEVMLDTMSKTLLRKMDEERARPGFEYGTLGPIIDAAFPKASEPIRMKCIRKFEHDNEIELNPAGQYVFYPRKIYRPS